jgi:hypothetical protein
MAPPLRTHDVVLADGTFRVVLTSKRRVVAVLDAPTTPLGPLHIVLAIDRAPFLPPGVSPLVLEHHAAMLANPAHVLRSMEMAGLFDDIGHFVSHAASDIGHVVSHAAEGAFNAASKVATTLARPVFDLTKTVTSEGMHLLAHTIPFLPADARRKMDAAARVVMRAHLGDLTAKQFIHAIGDAAKAGVHAAQIVGNTLLDASKVVAHVIDLPVLALQNVPGVGNFLKGISPLQAWGNMTDALKKGDFKRIGDILKQQLSTAQSVISLIPGIGTGISAAISAGLAILSGGGPLEIAIKTAYGAIPIPPGIRQVTDMVLDSVLALAFHGTGQLTDVAINVARDAVPQGLPRDVFDTLISIVHHKNPIQGLAGGLVDHFVKQYAPAGVGLDVASALSKATDHLPNVLSALPPHVLTALPQQLQLQQAHGLLQAAQDPQALLQHVPALALPGLALPHAPTSQRMIQPLPFGLHA